MIEVLAMIIYVPVAIAIFVYFWLIIQMMNTLVNLSKMEDMDEEE